MLSNLILDFKKIEYTEVSSKFSNLNKVSDVFVKQTSLNIFKIIFAFLRQSSQIQAVCRLEFNLLVTGLINACTQTAIRFSI